LGTTLRVIKIELASLDTGIGMLVYHGGETGSLTVQGDANIGVGLSGTGIKGWGDRECEWQYNCQFQCEC